MQVQHRLIIRHPRDAAILVEIHDGQFVLPAFIDADRHTADVDYINAAARDRFGLTTTVLRSVSHSDAHAEPIVRIHELEVQGPVPPSEPMRWVRPEQRLFASADRAAVAHWHPPDARRDVTDGREWTQPHWFDQARRWIEQTTQDAGLGPALAIVQLRAWASSCVLRVRVSDGEYYFKALPASGDRECAVTRYLAQHFPDVVPRIVACEPTRRWLLLAACAGHTLEALAEPAAWERAASRYAQLQVACVARVPALRALGCPVHDLETLARRIEPLCNDASALRAGQPGGLRSAEIERLQKLVPTLRRHCEQLGAAGIGLTLEHGDLWPGNVFVDAGTCTIIDWEDVMIAHPFFSLAPLSVGLRNSAAYSPELLARLDAAYLSAFAGFAPKAQLRNALRIAAPLGFIDMAIRYRHQRPSVAALHPWMHDLVPETLRLALACVV
jgi:Phosphotransferase enzyme family